MKTKELIARLQKADPEGDTEVVVGGHAIYFLENLPGYYDGDYEVLIQNDSPWYNIDGVKITKAGRKIKIHTMSLEDVLWDNPEAKVEIDPSIEGMWAERHQKRIEAIRAEVREVDRVLSENSGLMDKLAAQEELEKKNNAHND